MSSSKVTVLVKFCLSVPCHDEPNKNVVTLLDQCENIYESKSKLVRGRWTTVETLKRPTTQIAGWEVDWTKERTLRRGKAMFGWQLSREMVEGPPRTIMFVLCSEDDNAYFVGEKVDLELLKREWKIAEDVQENVELWTMT